MRRLIPILVGAATAVLGWRIGRIESRTEVPNSTQVQRASAEISETTSRQTSSEDSKPILSEKTEALLARVTSSAMLAEIAPDILEFAKTLSNEEFPSAIAAARTSKNRYASRLSGLLAGYWTEVDLEAAKAWMLSGGTANVNPDIVQTWARIKPGEMLGWFESLSIEDKKRQTQELANVIAYTAGNFEPARAAHILLEAPRRDVGGGGGMPFSGNSDYDSNAPFITGIFERWANRAPRAAAQEALSLPSGSVRTAAVISVVQAWALSDPVEAKAWLEALPDAVLAARAIPAFAIGLVSSDPRGAVTYLANQQLTDEIRDTLMKACEVWAARDFDGAAAWVRTLPEEQPRWSVIAGLINGLTKADVDKAAATLIADPTLCAGAPISTVVKAYLSAHGADATFSFAEKLGEPFCTSARQAIIINLANNLKSDVTNGNDRTRDWIRETTSLTTEEKAGLLRAVSNR